MPKNCVAIFVNRARRVANARPLAGTSSSSSSSSSWSSRHLRCAVRSHHRFCRRARGRLFLSFCLLLRVCNNDDDRPTRRCPVVIHHRCPHVCRSISSVRARCSIRPKNALVFCWWGERKRALFVTHGYLFTLVLWSEKLLSCLGEFVKGKSPTKKIPLKKVFRV